LEKGGELMRNSTKIDPKVRSLVNELQRLGIETFSSCQGHLESGLKYPWIDIVPEDARKLLSLVTWYNIQVYKKKAKSKVVWIILPRATMRLKPDENGFSLKELQESAMDFAKKLQELKNIPKLPGTS
jgi:hypothetical protein